MNSELSKLIENVDELSEDLKAARKQVRFGYTRVVCNGSHHVFVTQMNDAITDSALYKKILAFVLDEGALRLRLQSHVFVASATNYALTLLALLRRNP